MFSRSKRKAASKIDTLIGSHTEIRGDVLFAGGLHIDGKVIGNVIAESGSGSVISLSEQGVIEGEVLSPMWCLMVQSSVMSTPIPILNLPKRLELRATSTIVILR